MHSTWINRFCSVKNEEEKKFFSVMTTERKKFLFVLNTPEMNSQVLNRPLQERN